MADLPKPRMTGGSHPLPFEQLAPLEFERLCLWLVRREGYERAEHLGEAGSEQGRDVVAWKDGRRTVFQCKRVRAFAAAHAHAEIAKLRALPPEEQPAELVFVVSRAVSAATRAAARAAWAGEVGCHFWAGNELDERVKRHPDLLKEFFQLPPEKGPPKTRRAWFALGIGLSLLGVALAWQCSVSVPRILLVARDLEEQPLSGLRFAYGGAKSLATSQTGATELELPAGHREGQPIKILLLPDPKRSAEWFLVNPQVNIPSGEVSAEVVLMRRSAFRQLAAAARDASGEVTRKNEPPAQDRKRILAEAAARHGLTAEQMETALRSFAETQDPKDRGIALYLEGQYAQAEELLDRVVDKKESDFVEVLRYLGATQFEQAKYRAAADSFQKAIALRGEDTALLDWLGRALFELAAWAEAEPLMRRALAIAEKSFGTDHPNVATALNNLAALLQATNRLAEAEPLMRRALEIDEKSFGTDPPNVARDLNNLATLLQATNRHAKAEPLLRRALAIDEKSFGKDHPDVATALNNLAQLLQATNRLAEAEPLMRRALAIDEKSFGPVHPVVATDLNNLAQLLQATNRLAEAELLLRRALEIDEKSFGKDHPDVATALNNLAQLLQATNRLAEAEPLIARVVTIFENSLGEHHPNVATALNNLAALLKATNRLAEAEPLVRRALAIDEKSFGPDHPDVATDLNNLAQLLNATNRLGEAEPLMRRALDIDEKSFGKDHPNVAIRLNNLAQLLYATNRLGEAEPLMRRALAILLEFGRRTGHHHPHREMFTENYRILLQEMGKSPAEIEAAIEALAGPPG